MRIYIAGKYSDSNIIGCLNNIHDGIKASVEVLKQGHAPRENYIRKLEQNIDKSKLEELQTKTKE